VAERLAQPHHRHRDHVVRDGAPLPDAVDQLGLGDQLTRVAHERREQSRDDRIDTHR
jgi:hypothetical protein